MHQCLSCNQPCDLSSMFCDTCRASLLARRDQAIAEKQPEMAKAGASPAGERTHSAWDVMGDEELSLPEVPPGQQIYAELPLPAEETNSWSRETTDNHTPEDAGEAEQKKDSGDRDNQARNLQETHLLPLPRRARRVLPRNVRRALWIFCVVGVLALLTDGTLLVLSVTHHRPQSGARTQQPGVIGQLGTSPTPGAAGEPVGTPTGTAPTGTAQVNAASLLVLSTQHLAFNAVQGQNGALSQTITLAADRQGFVWQAESADSAPPWLRLSTWQGSSGPGIPASFVVSVSPADLGPDFYTANLQIKAFDAQGKSLSGSPTTLSVSLTVHPPCTLHVTPEKLTFTSVLLSVPPVQTLTLNENPNCAYPISWQVSSDASWLTVSRSSGSETATGSTITVQVNTAGKLIGSYTAHLTFQGTDSSGTPLVASSATITVTLTVIA